MTSATRKRRARPPPLGPTFPVSPIDVASGLGKLSPVTRADFGALTGVERARLAARLAPRPDYEELLPAGREPEAADVPDRPLAGWYLDVDEKGRRVRVMKPPRYYEPDGRDPR